MLVDCAESVNSEYALFNGLDLEFTESTENKKSFICYDFFNLRNCDNFAYDVKVIHRLLGRKSLVFSLYRNKVLLQTDEVYRKQHAVC